jgi:hypothetical protein
MKLLFTAVLATIGTGAMATAHAHGAHYVYATYDDCVADGEAGTTGWFSYACVPTDGGWEIVWTHLKRVHGTK